MKKFAVAILTLVLLPVIYTLFFRIKRSMG